MLSGPIKVGLFIAGEPHELEEPWHVAEQSLPAIDAHFWDWALWLTSKRARGLDDLVHRELERMHRFLLGPLAVDQPPSSIREAVELYLPARAAAERRLRVRVDRRLEAEVRPVLSDQR